MKRLTAAIFVLIALFSLSYLAVEHAKISVLTDPTPWLRTRGPSAALIGVALLASDVLVPVPSSIVMFLNGALFGIPCGTLLSLAGATAASCAGWAMGRAGSGWLARAMSDAERERVTIVLRRYGFLAIVASRPVPMLAEAVNMVAGAAGIPFRRNLLGSLLGLLPTTALYAVAGSTAGSLRAGLLSFLAVMAVTGVLWFCGRRALANESSDTRSRR